MHAETVRKPLARRRTFLLVGVCASLIPMVLQPVKAGADPQDRAGFQKGVSFAAWWSGQYSDPGADISLAALQTTGAAWISLIVTAYQDHYTSTQILYTGAHTPTDEDLVHVINLAHSRGLKVMLKPHLDLADEAVSGRWRGDIGTGFTNRDQWAAWFASYRAFILHYAALAQVNGADQFCIGTELLGTTQRAAEWRETVAAVRAAYSGPILYASLHSGEERSITWWDAVDLIGVDAYYPLNWNLSRHPTVEQLERSWKKPKALLANLSATYGKPIIFTEIGYRSQHGSSVHPWDSWTESAVDPEEQANAYEAAFRQVYNEPWLGGIFWWSWYADRFKSGPCDDSYSPKDKPAETILRNWYGGTAVPPAPALNPDYSRTLDIYSDRLAPDWQNWSWKAQVNLGATDQSHSGSQSIFVTLSSWGALSLHHPSFDATQYAWLEFYVRAAQGSDPNLKVSLQAADGSDLAAVPVNDCRYIDSGVGSQGWTRVRIPVRDLNVAGVAISRVSIVDRSGSGASFWVDDLRLVAGK